MELSEIYLNALKDLEIKLNATNVKKLITNTIKWSLGYGESITNIFEDSCSVLISSLKMFVHELFVALS